MQPLLYVFTLRASSQYIPSALGLKDQDCEKEVAEAAKGDSDERKSESILRFSWALVHSRQALVHSRQPEDTQRGIAMLEASLSNCDSPSQKREKLYLLAVGYYRSGDDLRSRLLLEQCLEIAPDWRQALSLRKAVEDHITKDGVIGIGITATAVGLNSKNLTFFRFYRLIITSKSGRCLTYCNVNLTCCVC